MRPEFQHINTGQIRLRLAIYGEGPLILMVHGFPESWYSWRHQFAPIAASGYRVCAIDVRGYGGSDKPEAVEAYSLEALISDLVAIRHALSPDGPVILVGHDWGAPIVWNAALIHPDKFDAVCGMSVAYSGVPDRPATEVFTERFTNRNRFFYQAYFQQEGIAEAELEADVSDFLRKFYFALSGDAPDGTYPNRKTANARLLDEMIDPVMFPPWLTPADIDYYVSEFSRSGFRGPLNRYRNYERDFSLQQQHRGKKIKQPSLFIAGDRDMALSLSRIADPIEQMRTHLTDLRGAHILPGCGHWTQQERPDEVNSHLLAWLGDIAIR